MSEEKPKGEKSMVGLMAVDCRLSVVGCSVDLWSRRAVCTDAERWTGICRRRDTWSRLDVSRGCSATCQSSVL